MIELSLRQYLQCEDSIEEQTIRSCCSPSMKTINLRRLILSPRIIHISDVHCTSSGKTWNVVDGIPVLDDQDSLNKINNIMGILKRIKQTRLTSSKDIVVITGDITDSGGVNDYQIAVNLINDIKSEGFDVYVIPGNHDYCWEGLIFMQDVFKFIKALSVVEALVPGALEHTILLVFSSVGIFLNPFDPFGMAIITSIASMFSITIQGQVIENTTDTVENIERRNRFIKNIISNVTPYSLPKLPDPFLFTNYRFPHIIPIDNGYLILVDSMQGQLDSKTGDSFAQGDLGKYQFKEIESHLLALQTERAKGKRVILCIHHSPFVSVKEVQEDNNMDILTYDKNLGLNDQEGFVNMIRDKIDCLLYGHTTGIKTPKGIDQRPFNSDDERKIFSKAELKYKIPLINCENLEDMNSNNYYSVTLVNPYSYRRVVYTTSDLSVKPIASFGNLS